VLLGVVGAPNKGKSTFFSAATAMEVAIANYPFTTINPNKGVTYARAKCPDKEFGTKCTPRVGKCIGGTRLVPINIVDVAGLVPGAHLGKGMGNQFLDDLRQANALIQVIDASGQTDLEGNPAQGCDPMKEVEFLEQEIDFWFEGVIKRNWQKVKGKGLEELVVALSGLNAGKADIEKAAAQAQVSLEKLEWNDDEIFEFATQLRRITKPIIVAANKADLPSAEKNIAELKGKLGKRVVACSAIAELALRKAANAGAIEYFPGDSAFKVIAADEKQRQGLDKISRIIQGGGSGVQTAVDQAVFDVLGLMPVYPVEDEKKLCDNFGRVLPDALFVKKGTTALELAALVHTDLAKHFICAINARTHMKVGKEHALASGDIIRIVAGKA